MAKQFGENALAYINGVRVPLANEWSIDIEQEKVEAPRVFVCPPGAGTDWTDRAGGYFSASGSISALYDAADTNMIDYVLADTAYEVLLYPECGTAQYWEGNAWIQVSMSAPVDNYVTADFDFESTGQWQWME